ncbi:MAG: MoxR family ATPase [Acidobacteria bacterium]|nr:MAG: MoxR family ATPase [Acidobacteriota bacterium]
MSQAQDAAGGELTPEQASELVARLLARLEEHVLGQRAVAEQLAATYLAGGHALIEGVPGVGKTLLARCFAALLGAELKRVQLTPDLMPTDLIGTNVFDQSAGRFHLVRGPIFTQVLLADEINRTPPKTQSALLEAMQERQVTIDGTSHVLDDGFFVVATQNPIEHEGTYPLPEAQLDRFLTRITMGPPAAEAELELFRRATRGRLTGWSQDLPPAVTSPQEARALRRAARTVHVAEELLDYLARLAAAVRESELLELAVSPRAALALLETARAAALVDGRDYLVPDDLKRSLEPCWGHRLILTAEAELEGHSAGQLLRRVADEVEIPQ